MSPIYRYAMKSGIAAFLIAFFFLNTSNVTDLHFISYNLILIIVLSIYSVICYNSFYYNVQSSHPILLAFSLHYSSKFFLYFMWCLILWFISIALSKKMNDCFDFINYPNIIPILFAICYLFIFSSLDHVCSKEIDSE